MHYRRFTTIYSHILLCVAGITLWTATKSFQKLLSMDQYRYKADSPSGKEDLHVKDIESHLQKVINRSVVRAQQVTQLPKWKSCCEMFSELKILADLINQSIGHLPSVYVVMALLYYSTYADEIFIFDTETFRSLARTATFGVNLLLSLGVIYFTADAPYNVLDKYYFNI